MLICVELWLSFIRPLWQASSQQICAFICWGSRTEEEGARDEERGGRTATHRVSVLPVVFRGGRSAGSLSGGSASLSLSLLSLHPGCTIIIDKRKTKNHFLIFLLLFFSRQVVSDSATPWTAVLQPSLFCPVSICSNSRPLSRWCHPAISSSVAPFSSCPQSFPASGSFLMSQPFASGGQSNGASASASVLPMNIQGWFPFRIDWLDLLAVEGTLKNLL